MLEAAYLVFQTEVGVGGDVLKQSYESLSCLASHGFFKILWQLLLWYSVTLNLPFTLAIPLLWEDNQPFMEAILNTGRFTSLKIVEINRFRHWKKVHSIRDVFLNDSPTIYPTMTTRLEGSSLREFPLQHPPCSEFTLWKCATGFITISGTNLQMPLGEYIGAPNCPDIWFTDAEGSWIYQALPSRQCKVYERPRAGRSTQFGTTYIFLDTTIPQPVLTHRISIWSWNRVTLWYHSSRPLWIPQNVYTPRTLLRTLASWDNASLWTNLLIKGDDCGWIFCGLMQGSLTINHDGSYLPLVANNVCSCTIVFYCSHDN
jgi:hypothetical protein